MIAAVRVGMRRIGQRHLVTALLSLILALAILYPLWLVLQESFQVSRADPTFTLQWYTRLFEGRLLGVLQTTAILVITSATLALVIGAVLAWMIERVEIPFRFGAALVPLAPLLIPPVVGAAAWAFLLSPRAGYINSFVRFITGTEASTGPFNVYSLWGIIFVVTLYVIPFTYTVIAPSLRSMDASLEEAAAVSGASTLTTALTVTLGILRPALLGALVLSVVISLAHFAIPLMLGRGQVSVLTTEIYGQLRGYPPNRGAATALSMFAVVPSLLLLGAQYWFLRRGGYSVVGGKAGSRQRIQKPAVRWTAGSLVWLYALVASILPFLALTVVAFSPFWNGRIVFSSFSTQHFDFLFNSYRGTWLSIRTSVQLALIGSTVSVTLAFLIAYITVRGRGRIVRGLDFVGTLPLGVPTTIFGVGFLFMFTSPAFVTHYNTIVPMLVAYLVIFLPHAIRPTSAAVRQISTELEDASRMSGTGWLGTIGRITLPLALPSLAGAWILLFVILSREVAASVFLIAPRVRVIGVTILDLWNNGQSGAVAAFSLVVVLVSIVFIVIAQVLASRLGWSDRRPRRRIARLREFVSAIREWQARRVAQRSAT